MELQVIGTGSSGNAYALHAGGDDGQILLLDAGLPARQITSAVKPWRNVAGCLITHEHGDHIRSAEEIARLGVKTYATPGTIEAATEDGAHSLLNGAKRYETFQVGDFLVMAFETQHDAAEPCGWLIRYQPTGETAVYATDTYYLKHTFPGVNYWLVECNYCEDILDQQTQAGEIAGELRGRLVHSHMSLRRLKEALQANDLTEARAIILLHLSDERSDESRMEKTIREATGIEDVHAARAGETYALCLTPF